MIDLSRISTEQNNEASAHIDQLSTVDILRLINDEDAKVAAAVRAILPEIEKVVDAAFERMTRGGRLIYVGSGSSGRMGVLDAAECPPTYGTDPKDIFAIMAGGRGAVFVAVEGAEDDAEQGRLDLEAANLTQNDVVVGIAASGRTPYVIGALKYANRCGAFTVALTSVEGAPITELATIALTPQTGPEVITGSTRMKNGTAQKFILNMLTTTLMIKQGKVYGNLMVDLKASNAKLRERAISTVRSITGAEREDAIAALEAADMHVKTAVVMYWHSLTADEACEALDKVKGHLHLLSPEK